MPWARWPASPDTLAALLGALASDSATVRQSAAEALARLAAQPAAEGVPSSGPETAAALLDLLQSDDAPLVRRAAALALGHLGDPVARDALEASQADGREDPLVRKAAGEALGRLRRRSRPRKRRSQTAAPSSQWKRNSTDSRG